MVLECRQGWASVGIKEGAVGDFARLCRTMINVRLGRAR